MPKKPASNQFNLASEKLNLLQCIVKARGQLEVFPSLGENIRAFDMVRGACEILERKLGCTPKEPPISLKKAISKDRAEHPVLAAEYARAIEKAVRITSSHAFGMLDALLCSNDQGKLVLVKMDNQHRLRVCRRAEERLLKAILNDLQLTRVPKNKKGKSWWETH